MDEKDAELIINYYKTVEDRFLEITTFIPYNDTNKVVNLPILSGIIVESGSLIDIIFREEYNNKSKDKEKLNIRDFSKYYESKYKLSSIRTIPIIYPPTYMDPFKSWIGSSGEYLLLKWWDSYNNLKHQRIEHQDLSTLENAMLIVCALHQVISQFPIFFEALIRNDMVAYGSISLNYAKKRNNGCTVLIESKLFFTLIGSEQFPEDPKNINPSVLQLSKKLVRFLVRDY